MSRQSLQDQTGISEFAIDSSGPHVPTHALRMLSTRPSDEHDVLFSQNFGAIAGGLLKCAFVHDALFVDHPEWFSKKEKIYLSTLRPSLLNTDLIFTSSVAEASRIRRVWPRLSTRVRPIGLGLPNWVDAEPDVPALGKSNNRPYVLAVGRLNIRKNLRNLIAAYQTSTARFTHDLVIVGEANGLSDNITGRETTVRFASGVSDRELKWFYLHADAFVFASLDEGFGLPLIEAHHFGLPTCASDIAPFQELGLADLYFDPYSVEDISRALDRVIGIPKRQMNISSAFSWTMVVDKARAEIAAKLAQRRL